MSYEEYQNLRCAGAIAAFERASRALGQEVERQGLTEEELLAEQEGVRR